ncbi:MAG: MazG nucleotide pyrophosphohydrolase domain-containing protein, partial [Myxococcota bacterium]|nr:MazG nucleotide pyrophosphohydrolase domain-containing protein [Myxococcota bacterium]
VFGDEEGGDAAAVAVRWEELKKAEGKGRPEDVPRSLPALSRAATVGKKASQQGFDWPDIEGPQDKLVEELGELKEALAEGPQEAVVHELGDLLFAAVNVARHAGVDPELALRAATDRFLQRYGSVQTALAERGLTTDQAGLELLDQLWEEAKA